MIGNFAHVFSKDRKIVLVLFLLLPSIAPAMLTTVGQQRVTWTVVGVPDSELVFQDRQETPSTLVETYTAPYTAGQDLILNAQFPKIAIRTNTIPWTRDLSFGIPYGRYLMKSKLDWSQGCPTPEDLDLTQGDVFSPNRKYDYFSIHAFAQDMNTNLTAGPTMTILIKVYPSQKYRVTNEEWLKGLPEYEGIKEKKADGKGTCSAMGLPGWRVSSAACNLLIDDTDFAYLSPGPGVRLTRYYNADPTVIGMFGRSWSFEYESSIDAVPLGARLRKGTGQVVTYGIADTALDTNQIHIAPEPGYSDILIVTVTNRWGAPVGRSTLSDYVYPTNWDGSFVPAYGEVDAMTYRHETNSGRHIYELRQKSTGWTWHYESTNRHAEYNWLTYIEDLNSNRLYIWRNASGRITNITDSVGRMTLFQYSPAGYCTNMIVPGGARASFTYDASGNLRSSVDLAGNISYFSYDTNHYVTNIITGGESWTFRWTDGFVSEVIDPRGFTNTYYRFATAVTNRQTQHGDPYGRYTLSVSDFGGLILERDPNLYERHTRYSNGLPVIITNKLGYVRRMTYDERRNVVQTVDFAGATNRFTYNTNDWLVAVTNALGRVYRFEYDARGNLTNAVLPSGRRVCMTYNAQGLITSLADPAGHTSTFAYNSLGNLVAVTDPAGYVTRFGWDAAGINIVAVTNARGHVTRLEYDNNRRLTKITFPDGSVRSNYYDCCAQTRVTDEEGRNWLVGRDAQLNLTSRVDALGRTVRYTYDRISALASITNAAGLGYSMSNDFRGRPLEMLKPYGDRVRFSRDAEGRVAMLYPTTNYYKDFIWWVEPQYQFTYDGEGRVLSDTSRRSTYTRDALGRVTNRRNARLQDIGFTYDEDGRLQTRSYFSAPISSNTYDVAGRLASVRDSTGVTSFEHDSRGLVTAVTWPSGLSVSFQYDENGNERSVTYPGGPTITYQYDSRDRVTNMSWNGGSLSFSYDRVGNLLQMRTAGGAQGVFAYDPNNRITNITHSSVATNILTLRYQRDVLGQATNIVKTSGVAPWLPLMTATSIVSGHDAFFAATNLNAAVLTYDADKNVTNLTGDRALSAEYDPDNRVTTISLNGTNRTYAYDGLGRRVAVTQNGVLRKLHFDHRNRLLLETDSGGTMKARYFYRGRNLVAMQDASGTHYYHFDARGSTVAMTDSEGKISALYRYLAYGEVAGGYCRATNPFTFVGEHGVMDDGDGLYFMATRMYDAVLGRFLSRDPIGARGGLNLYAYADGNPIDFIDPWGMLNRTKAIAGTVNMVVGFPLMLFGIGTANPLAAAGGGFRWFGGMKQVVQAFKEEDDSSCSVKSVVWQTAVPSDFIREQVENVAEALTQPSEDDDGEQEHISIGGTYHGEFIHP